MQLMQILIPGSFNNKCADYSTEYQTDKFHTL